LNAKEYANNMQIIKIRKEWPYSYLKVGNMAKTILRESLGNIKNPSGQGCDSPVRSLLLLKR
jgi:hypothetical protein